MAQQYAGIVSAPFSFSDIDTICWIMLSVSLLTLIQPKLYGYVVTAVEVKNIICLVPGTCFEILYTWYLVPVLR